MITIYKIENLITHEIYIGQTTKKLNERINSFCNYRSCPKLNEALKIYGKKNFSYELLEVVSEEQADVKERFYIDKFDTLKNGYNKNNGGKSGFKMIDDSKQKISNSRKGQHNSLDTEFKKGHKPIPKALIITEQRRKKLSETHKGKHASPRTEFKKGDQEGAKNTRAYPVYQYSLDGKLIAKYNTAKEAAEINHLNRGKICSCRTGRISPKYGGYIWSATLLNNYDNK